MIIPFSRTNPKLQHSRAVVGQHGVGRVQSCGAPHKASATTCCCCSLRCYYCQCSSTTRGQRGNKPLAALACASGAGAGHGKYDNIMSDEKPIRCMATATLSNSLFKELVEDSGSLPSEPFTHLSARRT